MILTEQQRKIRDYILDKATKRQLIDMYAYLMGYCSSDQTFWDGLEYASEHLIPKATETSKPDNLAG